jgi:hypothetical protein
MLFHVFAEIVVTYFLDDVVIVGAFHDVHNFDDVLWI